MGKQKDTGVYQLENGTWAYRFKLIVNDKEINRRRTKDEFGNKLKTKREAIKARDNAILQARLDEERKHKIVRKTVREVYNEY